MFLPLEKHPEQKLSQDLLAASTRPLIHSRDQVPLLRLYYIVGRALVGRQFWAMNFSHHHPAVQLQVTSGSIMKLPACSVDAVWITAAAFAYGRASTALRTASLWPSCITKR